MVLFLTGSDCHCKIVLQHFCTQIISDVYVQCSRLKTSRPVPQGSLVGYWVLPSPLGHYTFRPGRQNRSELILKLLASQSLSYMFVFNRVYLLFLLCLPICCRRPTELVLYTLQNYQSGVCLFPYFSFLVWSLFVCCPPVCPTSKDLNQTPLQN